MRPQILRKLTRVTNSSFDLDVAAVLPWFKSEGLTADGTTPFAAELLAGGRSNVTYRVRQNEDEWVLRRRPFGHVMPSAHDMEREFRVLTGMHRALFPSPEPFAYCADESLIGAPFLVMEFVDGGIYAHAEQTKLLSSYQRNALSKELTEVLAALHDVDAHAVGLADLGRPEGFLQRQVARWQKQWSLSRTRDFPAMDELGIRINKTLESAVLDNEWGVIHGDYRLDNTIVDPNTMRIRAVVDWEMSTLGDPLADLALLLVYWTQPGDRLRSQVPLTDGVTDLAGFFTRSELVESYTRLSGRSVDNLDACIALSCMKLGVILESIRKRMMDGAQVGGSDELAEQMRVATDALIEIGHLSISDGGLAALSS